MRFSSSRFNRQVAGFTMVEIAISLAVIAFALVAIIGVLPLGLNVQKDNRQETIIGQDASVFINAIRNGARGVDDLTNYVLSITKVTWGYQITSGRTPRTNYDSGPVTNFYTFEKAILDGSTVNAQRLTNGARIIGLLSTPKYEFYPGGFTSNFVSANFLAISGSAVEKNPQNNTNIQSLAFGYRLVPEVAPVASAENNTLLATNYRANLHELRLNFRWPLLPDTLSPLFVGNGRQTFRTQVGGRIIMASNGPPASAMTNLFFFEPQTFVAAP